MKSVSKFLLLPVVLFKQWKQKKLQQEKLQLLEAQKHQILDLCFNRFNLVTFSQLQNDGSVITQPETLYLREHVVNADHIYIVHNDEKICCILIHQMKVTSTIGIDLKENQYTGNAEKWYQLSELSGEVLMSVKHYS